MKIVQVSNFFKPSWEAGGPPRVVYEISKELVNRGHDVVVLTTDGFKKRVNVKKNKPVDVDGIKTYYFKNISSKLAKKVFLTPYYAPIVLRKEIKNSDVVHIHELSTLAFMAYYYARKYNVPIIFQAHGCLYLNIKNKKSFLGKKWHELFEIPILKNSDYVIAITKTERKDYESFSIDSKKIKLLPNGIDISKYENIPQTGNFRLKHNLTNKNKIILYLGRIHENKGLELLLNSFYALSCKDKTLRLVVAGPDDGFEIRFKKLVKDLKLEDKVLFTGLVTGTEKYEIYSDSEVYVLPREFEPFGLTLLESVACGTPVICSKNCGISEFIDGKVGIATNYSKKCFSDAIYSIIYNNELQKNFQKHFGTFLDEFNWKNIIDELEIIYLTLKAIK